MRENHIRNVVLEPEIIGFIDFLLTKHYHVCSNKFEPDIFGNVLIEVCSELLCFRIIRDRGQWFIDIKYCSWPEWIYIGIIRKCLTDEVNDSYLDIIDQITFIENDYEKILSMFNEENFGRAVNQLQQTQMKVKLDTNDIE